MKYEVVRSDTFAQWLTGLRDKRAQVRIGVRVQRIQEGNFGDHKSVGGGVSELRVNVGPSYRVYYAVAEKSW